MARFHAIHKKLRNSRMEQRPYGKIRKDGISRIIPDEGARKGQLFCLDVAIVTKFLHPSPSKVFQIHSGYPVASYYVSSSMQFP
jgi:hypothetical protein